MEAAAAAVLWDEQAVTHKIENLKDETHARARIWCKCGSCEVVAVDI